MNFKSQPKGHLQFNLIFTLTLSPMASDLSEMYVALMNLEKFKDRSDGETLSTNKKGGGQLVTNKVGLHYAGGWGMSDESAAVQR